MFEEVNNYYLSRMADLPFEKQFHFASRLWLWTGKKTYADILLRLKPQFCDDGSPDAVNKVLGDLLASQNSDFGSKNAAVERAPYFAHYPLLRQVLPLLFRLLFMKTIYNIDARRELKNHVDLDAVDKLALELANDREAIAILSTYACNFFYLWHSFFKESPKDIPVLQMYEIGLTAYDFSLTHRKLQFYLYTHCIIGDSYFYKRNLPLENLQVYRNMCENLENYLSANFRDINLDNKCEFIVACSIAGFSSKLKSAVHDEASRSMSPNGNFIIDRHNNNPQAGKITPEESEHRNVLLIMSSTDFKPFDQVVG